MQIAIPHDLSRDEVRRRLRIRSHTLADNIPGAIAEVATEWPTDDRMSLSISAMSQTMSGYADIEDRQVIFTVSLPPALEFLQPLIEGAIRQQGTKLLS